MPEGLIMKYFVLKPKGTDAYAEASRAGMRAYAMAIYHVNSKLAEELTDWVQREHDAINVEDQFKDDPIGEYVDVNTPRVDDAQ